MSYLTELENKLYLFVVDTDSYAGAFERELCAYVTGQVGDCKVGSNLAETAQAENPALVSALEEKLEWVPDDVGCYRPVSIFPNPRYGNDGEGLQALLTPQNEHVFAYPAYNSVAIYFRELPGADLVEALKARSFDFASDEQFKIEGFRLLERNVTYAPVRDLDA